MSNSTFEHHAQASDHNDEIKGFIARVREHWSLVLATVLQSNGCRLELHGDVLRVTVSLGVARPDAPKFLESNRGRIAEAAGEYWQRPISVEVVAELAPAGETSGAADSNQN